MLAVLIRQSGLMIVVDVWEMEFIQVEGKSHMPVPRNDDNVQMIETHNPGDVLSYQEDIT